MKLNDIISILQTAYEKYDNVKLGVAGSYVNGTQREDSDIDIVIDGDSTRTDIMYYIKSLFDMAVDILWVDLMRKEDEELDRFALDNDLPINQFSVYKTVMQEVRWV